MVRVDFYEILKLVMRTAIFHPSRNKSFSPSSFQVCIFKNFLFLDSRYLILDSRVLKLKRLKFQDARIKFRGSSRDCQLTFDWYCSRQYSVLNTDNSSSMTQGSHQLEPTKQMKTYKVCPWMGLKTLIYMYGQLSFLFSPDFTCLQPSIMIIYHLQGKFEVHVHV